MKKFLLYKCSADSAAFIRAWCYFGEIFLGGKFPGGKFLGDKLPGANFLRANFRTPVTRIVKNIIDINRRVNMVFFHSQKWIDRLALAAVRFKTRKKMSAGKQNKDYKKHNKYYPIIFRKQIFSTNHVEHPILGISRIPSLLASSLFFLRNGVEGANFRSVIL